MEADQKKIALITGANKGIGFETGRQLGNLGYKVLLGARDQQRGSEAAAILKNENIDAEAIVLDVTDSKSITNAADYIENTFGYLDVLINNAGIFLEKGVLPSQVDEKILRQTFEVNFFGAFAVTAAMMTLIKKAKAGRIVNVSSGQGSLTRSSGAEAPRLQLAYNSSKAALNAMTIQLAKELKGTTIKINAAAPGYTITDMNEGEGKNTVEQASKIIIKLATLDVDGPTGGYFEEAGEVPW